MFRDLLSYPPPRGDRNDPETLVPERLADRAVTLGLGRLLVLRAIDERKMLLEQLIEGAKVAGNEIAAQEYARQAEDAKMRSDEIRGLVMSPPPTAISAA